MLRAMGSSYTLRAKLFDSVICDSGAGGNEVAVFRGADGSEVFTYDGGENTARVQSAGRDHVAQGFTSILARAEGSARDVAYFTDVPGPNDRTDEVFYFKNHKTQLVGKEVKVTVRAFDEVHATASESGFDVARVYDTAGDEHLEIDGDTVRLHRRDGDELELLYEAVAFGLLKANSTEGDDFSDIGDTNMVLLLYGWDE